jgi:site-specific recombinase XerC
LQSREFAEILDGIPNDTLGVRDKAMILLVYTGRILSLALSKMERGDVHFTLEGMRINALYPGRKQWITIANHPDPRYCAVLAMRRYLRLISDEEAPVFRAATTAQKLMQRQLGVISAKQTLYKRLNPPGSRFRIGLRTLYVSALVMAINRGASDYRIMRQFGFRSIEEVRRWRERYGPASATIGEKLGL